MTMKATIEAFDGRAEGARRRIEVSEERIVIARRVGGVEMRVALEPRQYRGVGLAVLVAEATDFLYQVRLIHADPDLCVTLADCGQEEAARALWRRWAAALGLPRLVERTDGEFEIDRTAPSDQPFERRRGRATLKRRNRFLARRKMGRLVAAACGCADG
ncbi:MAG TPA: DUF6101 family protein [Roseiarcus sp.]|nr:DUF6101 family protein [Roseiarcus sp.]